MALPRLLRALSAVRTRRAKPIIGGGEMGRRVREFDWAHNPLGPLETWSPTLRGAVDLVLNSSYPLMLIWGPEHVEIYNDAFIPLMGGSHPAVLGQNYLTFWKAVVDQIKGPFLDALQGQPVRIEEQHMFTDRSGVLEELYVSYSYSALREESGDIAGVLVGCTDDTHKAVGDRRTRLLLELNGAGLVAQSLDDALVRSAQCLGAASLDVPFALLYRLDENQTKARLVGHAGLAPDGAASPMFVDLTADNGGWPLARLVATGGSVQLNDLETRFPNLCCGPFPEPVQSAYLQAVLPANDGRGGVQVPVVLVTGMSTRLPLTETHRAFHELLGSTLSHIVASALASDARQKQVEALASIDRAKSTFFSNISHEFRTPLTLLLGPLEDELSEPPPSESQRARLEVVHRNALRMLKLVNGLLDFSSFDAGRAKASFEPTDLGALTADLSGAFRSAIETAGLTLSVNCPRLPEPVFVDRDMWEKVVFNLLSNAFKHTFQGGIDVRLHASDGLVALEVEDTGVGIPAHELPRLFERFHRVRGARARTYEGTGIGLALVQDVVRMHGGALRVSSEEGRGSCFTATIRTGSAHLPFDQIALAASPATMPQRQRDTVANWLPAEVKEVPADETGGTGNGRPRILWVEDNADLRDYVQRLLASRYDVRAVENGARALAVARAECPDLVLSDVMMPELDGIELLRALRREPATRQVPVILLSARAGQEAAIDGLDSGADDYIVKPFTARELLSRVRSHLQLGRARAELATELTRKVEERTALLERTTSELRQSEEKFHQLAGVLDELFWVRDLATGEMLYISPAYERIWGRSRESLYAAPQSWTDTLHPEDRERVIASLQQPIAAGGMRATEYRIVRPDGSLRWVRVRVFPIHDDAGVVFRQAGVAEDITDRRQAEYERQRLEWRLQQSQKLEALGTLTGGIAHDFNNLLSAILGHTDLVREDLESTHPARASVEEIRTAGHRAKELVQRLLSFSRREEPQRKRLEVAPVLEEVVRLMRSTLPAGVELNFEPVASLPAIEGDPSSIHQIALNLITNAWQALQGNSGRIDIRLASCRVDTALQQKHPELQAGPHVRLSVSDTGTGIDADTLNRIFEPFFTTKAKGAGTGLGLSVVHGIIRSHGGAIFVESVLGSGSTFHVYFPASNGTAAREEMNLPRAEIVRGHGERILFIDDEPALVRLAIASLGRLGYRVEAYAEPAEALRAFRSDPDRFDLVITDYNMPQWSGLDVARALLQIRPSATVALVTGYLRPEEIEHARAIGIREILLKPISPSEFGPVVQRLLAESRPAC